MEHRITPQEADAALAAVERGRRRVVAEIDVPRWYWWGLALGWLALGFVTDLNHPWLTSAATLLFGATHAAVASRVLDGRRRTDALRVRRGVAGRRIARYVVAGLVAMALVTIAAALLLHADGAGHPATFASAYVAVAILLGGPRLVAVARERIA